MDALNRWIVESMLALHPSIFYEKGFEVAAALLGVVGGLIFVLSFVMRIAQEFGSPEPPRWMPAINDFIKSGAMLALYFAAWGMAVSLFNALYALFEDAGSIQSVFDSYGDIFSDHKANLERTAQEESEFSFGSLIGGGVDAIGTYFGEIASYLFFTISTLCVMLAYAITKLFHGLLFALAIIWGGLVWSVRPIVNLVRGWLLLTGLVLVWPLMESLVFLFLDLTITDALRKMIPQVGTEHEFSLVALEVILGVLNIIMGFVLVTIPIITSRLLANSDLSMELTSALTTTANGAQKAVLDGAGHTALKVLGLASRAPTRKSTTPTEPPLKAAPKTSAPSNAASSSGRSADTSASRPSHTTGQAGNPTAPNSSDSRSTLHRSDKTPSTGPNASTATTVSSSQSNASPATDSTLRQNTPIAAPINRNGPPPATSGTSAPTTAPSSPLSSSAEQRPGQSERSPTNTVKEKPPVSGSSNPDEAPAPSITTKQVEISKSTVSGMAQKPLKEAEKQARRDALFEAIRQRSGGNKS